MNKEIFTTDEYKANTGIVFGMYGGIGFYTSEFDKPNPKLKFNLFKKLRYLLSVVWKPSPRHDGD